MFQKLNGKRQCEDVDFYRQLTMAFPQYRAFKNFAAKSVHMATQKCPACPPDDSSDPTFVAIDANFRLCRRAKAASSSSENTPLIQPSMFLPQDDVDQYVNSIPSTTLKDSCSDFKAGDALRSQSRYIGLDETAVFGAICRHDIPLKMLSLKHGERIAYADYLLSALVDDQKLSRRVKLTYDIGCKLKSHWKSNSMKYEALLSRCEVAVPIFHSYAHKAACQYKYNPRNLEGFGLQDGENIERLWSYMGKFYRMTKEMSSANRVDLLTDALMYYSFLKQENLEKACVGRYCHAVKELSAVNTEISEILENAGLKDSDISSVEVSLRTDEETRLGETVPQMNETSWRVQYVKGLEHLQEMRNKWASILQQLGLNSTSVQAMAEIIQQLSRQENTVRRIEQDNNVSTRWVPIMEEYMEALKILNTGKQQHLKKQMLEIAKERTFYLNTLTHHAGGQKQANRVSKLIQGCTNRIKKLLRDYCNLQIESGDISQLSVKEVCDLQSNFWINDHSYAVVHRHDKLSATSQRRLLEVCCIQRRANEEKQYAISDLLRITEFYAQKLALFRRTISEMLLNGNDSTDLHRRGLVALLRMEEDRYKQKLYRCERTTQLIVSAYWFDDTTYLNEAKKNHVQSTTAQPISVREVIEDYIVPEFLNDTTSFWDSAKDSDVDSLSSDTYHEEL